MSDTLPERILLSGEEERWATVIRILQEIKNEMQGVKVEIAGLVRDQRDAVKEHSRLEVKIDHIEIRLDKFETEIKSLRRDRDDVKVTMKLGKFILGTGGIAGLIAWFKSLVGHQ
jgi:chromosome segregation ATPase